MHYEIKFEDGVVKAMLFGRKTADETQEFIAAVAAEALKRAAGRVMVSVRNSRPIFRVEQYRISEFFRQMAAKRDARVALLADSEELRAAHEYIEVLARQNGASVRTFRDEAAAREWLAVEELQSQETR